MRRGPNFFGNYQHVQNHDATTQSALMPTGLERSGDFSQTRNAFGQPVQLIDPSTGQPFSGNVIPADRISPQAASLLGYYPQPNVGGGGYNFQTPLLVRTRSDTGVTRLTHQFRGGREQFQGVLSYNRNTVRGGQSLFVRGHDADDQSEPGRQPLASAQPVHVPALAVSRSTAAPSM